MRGRKPPSIINWAGSKGRVARVLCELGLGQFKIYHEPFLGSAAAYLAFANAGLISGGRLSDLNPHLVNVFRAAQSHASELITGLRVHALLDSDVHFSSVLGRLNTQEFSSNPDVQSASDVIYLLSESFHSGWYETLEGQIYMSRRQNEKSFQPSYQNIVIAAALLRDAKILCRDFREALSEVCLGDFVFLDPPYLYGDDQRDQQAYNARRFGSRDLSDLSNEIRRLVDIGAQVVLCWGERVESLVPRTGDWIECGRDYCWISSGISRQDAEGLSKSGVAEV